MFGAWRKVTCHTLALWKSLGGRDVFTPAIKGQDPRPSEASDFRLTAPSSQLIFPHESNSQGGSLGSGLVRPRSSQLRGDAPLASHGAIDKHRFLGQLMRLWTTRLDVTGQACAQLGRRSWWSGYGPFQDSVPPVLPTPHLRAGLMNAVASRLRSRLPGRLVVQGIV
jgi:hypothetical protein